MGSHAYIEPGATEAQPFAARGGGEWTKDREQAREMWRQRERKLRAAGYVREGR